MIYIPNAREKFNETDGQKNDYWEGNLNEEDKKTLKTWDWCYKQLEIILDKLCDTSMLDEYETYEILKEMEIARNQIVIAMINQYLESEN